MATRTFSGRVDEGALAFADALARRDYGLSFGQYCGTILLDSIQAQDPCRRCLRRRRAKATRHLSLRASPRGRAIPRLGACLMRKFAI